MDIAVVVGNPKPHSRTLDAAVHVATELSGVAPTLVIDVIEFGAGLLEWGHTAVASAVDSVRRAPVVLFASPTYKATYTGVLKLFLDQMPSDALVDVVAVPLMLGAGPGHAMAPDLLLKPVLTELGATCPTRGLYLPERDYRAPVRLEGWMERARSQIALSSGVSL